MHGLGNDYIYVDMWREGDIDDPIALAIAISDRHRGVGSDGLILVGPPKDPMHADAKMTMYNADGSISEMCGNGLRCAAKFAWDHAQLNKEHVRFETGAGVLQLHLHIEGTDCVGATVDMGMPRLHASDIPVSESHSDISSSDPYIVAETIINDHSNRLICVGMGNPHAVCDAQSAFLEL